MTCTILSGMGENVLTLDAMPSDVIALVGRTIILVKLGSPAKFRELDSPMSIGEIVLEANKFHENPD